MSQKKFLKGKFVENSNLIDNFFSFVAKHYLSKNIWTASKNFEIFKFCESTLKASRGKQEKFYKTTNKD